MTQDVGPVEIVATNPLRTKTNDAGQVFVEFLLLFIAVIGMSFIIVRVTNSNLADRWEQIVNLIASPSQVKLR